jgi:hypothetical protein
MEHITIHTLFVTVALPQCKSFQDGISAKRESYMNSNESFYVKEFKMLAINYESMKLHQKPQLEFSNTLL